ncbi:MAG: ISAzo13 family transposase [Planctomycetaceae bacterium]
MASRNNREVLTDATETRIRDFADSLNEKDGRRFVAIEAEQYGHGGVARICRIVGCSAHTVERGRAELDSLDNDPAAGRVRRPGAGRKKIESESQAEENLISLLTVRVAGSPDEEDLIFTDLKPPALAEKLTRMGTPVCAQTVSNWLAEAGVRLRKIARSVAGGESADREAQFDHIADLIEQYEAEGNPWFSIDTKAKERLGMLNRKGRAYSSAPFEAFDHDFPSWADGVLIPHGIYDPQLNLGHINLGLSHDTSEFACESFGNFWQRLGRKRYPDATSILLTCDCGGSNPAGKYLFQVGSSATGRSHRPSDSHRTLPQLLQQVQSHRTPILSPRRACL